ncbi:MAG: serine/threonine protein kinase, partial [Myxococcales bacterium]|nr:serine/threonine protein kinase [Myxococcales bacterium]
DVQGEQPYLVMELVTDGRTLGEALREGLPVEVALDVLRQVSHALDAAHGIGVIHRDLKPGNVMLQAVQGNPWHVKLVDFGLAKRVDLQESTEFAAGTPVYMAPEQFDRKRLGPWTDWYAVGAMAFEMLAGRRPFEAPTAQELLGQKVRPDYDPTVRAPELPPETRAFLRRVLASDHRRRPQSGEAFR